MHEPLNVVVRVTGIATQPSQQESTGNRMTINRQFNFRNHSPFVAGWKLWLSNKRLLLWVYLVNLAVGLYVGLPFHGRISAILNHSMAADRIAGRLDVSAFGMLMLNLGQHGNSLHFQFFHAILVYGLIANVLAAGIYYVFMTGEMPRLAIVARSGIEYFWRFFRLMLFTIIICGAILALLGAIRSAILHAADNAYVGRTYFTISLVTAIIWILIALFLRLWFDIAEANVIQIGQTGVRRVRRTIGPAWRLLGRRFAAAYFGYVLVAICGAVGFMFFVWLWVAFVPAHAVFLAWIIGQLGVACLLLSRIWQRGLASTLVLADAADQPVEVPFAEPLTPVTASPVAPSAEPGYGAPASNPLPENG